MIIALYSNFITKHQLPFSLKMAELTDNNYTFVATEPFNQAKVSQGYKDLNKKYPFVLRSFETAESEQKAHELAKTADVMILGSASQQFIDERLAANKLTFRYTERLNKKKLPRYKYPIRFYRYHKWNPMNKPLYLLCASAYTAPDFALYGLFKNKAYKWGYFPEVKKGVRTKYWT